MSLLIIKVTFVCVNEVRGQTQFLFYNIRDVFLIEGILKVCFVCCCFFLFVCLFVVVFLFFFLFLFFFGGGAVVSCFWNKPRHKTFSK